MNECMNEWVQDHPGRTDVDLPYERSEDGEEGGEGGWVDEVWKNLFHSSSHRGVRRPTPLYSAQSGHLDHGDPAANSGPEQTGSGAGGEGAGAAAGGSGARKTPAPEHPARGKREEGWGVFVEG